MKIYKNIFIITIVFFCLSCASGIFGATPTLSLSNATDGDLVTLNVYGDANSAVLLFYMNKNIGLSIASLGTTDSSGHFVSSVSSASYGIVSGSAAYIKTGGISGISSNQLYWPYVSSTLTSSAISLSKTGLVLNIGSSEGITVNNNSSTLYLSNNTNPSVANINLSSSSITVTGNQSGSTIATVCVVGNSSNCASIYITVQNSGTTALTFSVNNLTIAHNTAASVTISGGTGSYYVLSNSDSSIITTSINGSVITLTAEATSGTSAITICSTNMSSCGIVTAAAGSSNSSYINVSDSNPTLSAGETKTITLSGPSGATYYINSNSNSGIVTASMSSNVLTLHGVINGTSIISVCSSLGSCASVTTTVTYTSSGGPLALSQSSLTLLVGQAASITATGGTTPYSLLGASNGIFQASLNSNVLTVYGISLGSSTLSVCSAEGGCVNLAVTVNSSTSSSSAPYFSQNNISLNPGNNATISIYGSGPFFAHSNSNSSVASVSISGSTALISGIAAGSTNISICQNSSAYCTILYVSVASSSSSTTITSTQTAQNTSSGYIFPRYLGYGDKGDDVLQLQKILLNKGYLTATPNGNFGPATKAAVQKFQAANGIRQTGNVGTMTKAVLDKLNIISSDVTNQQQISQIQQAIQQLQTQLSAMIAGQ